MTITFVSVVRELQGPVIFQQQFFLANTLMLLYRNVDIRTKLVVFSLVEHSGPQISFTLISQPLINGESPDTSRRSITAMRRR